MLVAFADAVVRIRRQAPLAGDIAIEGKSEPAFNLINLIKSSTIGEGKHLPGLSRDWNLTHEFLTRHG